MEGSGTAFPTVAAKHIMDILSGFQQYEILSLACKYAIFDEIEQKSKPLTVEDLAKNLDINIDFFSRFLNACSAMGLLIKSTNGEKAVYTNAIDTSTYLVKKSPFHILDYVALQRAISEPGYKLERLEESIKTGRHQIHAALKSDHPDDAFKTFYDTEERLHIFGEGMNAQANTCLNLVNGLKLDHFKNAVDLGGSFGAHARLLKKKFQNMEVTLADLKPVIEAAKEKPYNKDVKLNYVVCDFFDGSTLPKGDLFVLGHILHDWKDFQCAQIIKNIYNALEKGGVILILDKLLNPQKDGPRMICQQDLLLMAVTEGKERTEAEFRYLLSSQGFQNICVVKDDNSPYYDAVMAYKV